ncbi:ribosomal protein S18-alanine N-acetyltransferase [Thiomicrorhabdus sediminis]|uniref:Ribosomal-protein-alanine N-acetyltransferase n=1 Tax=Thiomicrorhabdus sediminis TaxID=2580412 RepID=A0A4P9K8G3_9GAMM|nr:ribosomal protein S18-alanine N-acetyltransferase [Thiomicrorhabdus sediminis]QCU90597.1 ribosomal-protein-alanine N-acetyltransferase [Thiomicrorhabdus sediminis]
MAEAVEHSDVFQYMRTMEDRDLRHVAAIEQQAYDYPWTEAGFERCLEQGINFVFCDLDEQIIGYCCILTVLDEAHLLNLCVSPRVQGKGIGRQALVKILERLQSRYSVVLLEVRESNHKARKLYQSLGFVEDGMRKNYYRCKLWDESEQQISEDREDAVLMSYRWTESY